MLPLGEALTYDFGPIEALRRWPAGLPVVMLHSGRFHPEWSRYSLLAPPTGALVYERGRSRWVGAAAAEGRKCCHDPFADLEAVTSADAGAFYVGYLGYDLGREVECLASTAVDDHGWPDMQFQRCAGGYLYDHAAGRWWRVGLPAADLPDLSTPGGGGGGGGGSAVFAAGLPRPDRYRRDHEAAVGRALDYIAAGDVFQVNLAQRFTGRFEGSTRAVYAALARQSPAWYGCYLEMLADAVGGDSPADTSSEAATVQHVMAGTSPELFLALEPSGEVLTRPIKGTRPASVDPCQLRDSAKDTAELNMIVDLLRNDLGRVCGYGSVRVIQPRTIESHPTVHHGVATVAGRLRPDRSLADLLRATFPGGSVTGAPKVRAMQIIEELEPCRRGPYCGAAGLIGFDDGRPFAKLNLTIRTLLLDRRQKTVRFSVGGGIVADSDPAAEYEETLDKAAALRATLGDQRAVP